MTYQEATALLNRQDTRLRKINGLRFSRDGYEYRIFYEGGFAPYVGIDRRPVGKRNFKYFGGLDVSRCTDIGEVIAKIDEEIKNAERSTK